MSIQTSSFSLLIHLGPNPQPYTYQSVIQSHRPERVPRTEETASGRGTNLPSGRGERLGQRKEPAAVFPSSKPSLSQRSNLGGSTTSYRGKREQACVDRCMIMLISNLSRPERAAVDLSMTHSSITEGGDSSGGEDRLGQRKKRKASNRMSIDKPSISVIIHLGQSAQPYTSQ